MSSNWSWLWVQTQQVTSMQTSIEFQESLCHMLSFSSYVSGSSEKRKGKAQSLLASSPKNLLLKSSWQSNCKLTVNCPSRRSSQGALIRRTQAPQILCNCPPGIEFSHGFCRFCSLHWLYLSMPPQSVSLKYLTFLVSQNLSNIRANRNNCWAVG